MHTSSQDRCLPTREKALQINLKTEVYGTFAEIGAGQEVAAQFFKAGLASGSIAKTMSAYDMTFSDAIYGPSERYVSIDRLYHMLKKEHDLLTKRLSFEAKRKTFFVFANTIVTISSSEKNGHGWIGVRFQLHPNTPPNDCVLHIVLKDQDIEWQQQTLGIVGVNLLYACYFFSNPDELVLSLKDNLREGSVEVDMFKLEGPDFSYIDNRLMSLKLVRSGLTEAAMFGPDGNVLQPSEALYKRDVLVLRGRFKPVTHVSVDMMLGAMKKFRRHKSVDVQSILPLSELTLNDLAEEGEIDEHDFLDRVDILCSLGQHVLISNYVKYFRLSTYISECTQGRAVGIIMGYGNLIRVFDESYYEQLRGGLLQAMGGLFGRNVFLFIYPCLKNNKMFTSQDVDLGDKQMLFNYLYQQGRIVDISATRKENLRIISDNVLSMLQNGEEGWEAFVPHKVSKAIKENSLFNYPTKVEVDRERLGVYCRPYRTIISFEMIVLYLKKLQILFGE